MNYFQIVKYLLVKTFCCGNIGNIYMCLIPVSIQLKFVIIESIDNRRFQYYYDPPSKVGKFLMIPQFGRLYNIYDNDLVSIGKRLISKVF